MIIIFTGIVIAITKIINSNCSGEGSESGDSWGTARARDYRLEPCPRKASAVANLSVIDKSPKSKYMVLVCTTNVSMFSL